MNRNARDDRERTKFKRSEEPFFPFALEIYNKNHTF